MEKPALKGLLQKAGFKVTTKRLELLDVLWKQHKPLSVGMIEAELQGDMNAVTLYRALEALADANIIRRVDLGHGHAHYEMEKKHHHHVVCTDCGTIEDVSLCPLPELQKSSRRFKSIYSHNVEFFGVCRDCTK